MGKTTEGALFRKPVKLREVHFVLIREGRGGAGTRDLKKKKKL